MGLSGVSAREAEVLDALGRHRSNSEIAAELFISVRTVESHVSSLLRKLDAPNRQALARLARPGDSGPALPGAPGTFTSFVGRRREAQRLADAVTRGRLVTLTGPGGVGKTRLAIEVASGVTAFPRWFADLLPAGAGWVVQTVAAVIGVSEQPDRSLIDSVAAAVSDQSGLLVLDNCEHVLDAAGDLVGSLLRACPSLRILATSREPIAVPGEHVVTLGPMEVTTAGVAGDAAILFSERAAAVGVAVDAEDPTVREVCARLDGMPLAIELAAVRCGSLGLDRVHEALVDRMALLAGSRDVDRRHRSLRAALDWSFELLSRQEQELLWPLGVFAGWFGPGDATAIAPAIDEPMVLALGRLASKSLLVRSDSPDGTWFRPLETVRAYLVDHLTATGQLEAAVDRHVSWAAGQAGALENLMLTGGDWRPTFDRVIDDLRTALQRVSTETGRDGGQARPLARALGRLCYGSQRYMEAHGHYRLSATLADDTSEAVDDLMLAGHCAFGLGHGDSGYDAYVEAADRAASVGLPAETAFALALAAGRARRFRGLFRRDIPVDELEDHYRRAAACGGGLGRSVDAQLACARAWLDGPDFASAERAASVRAVERSRACDDPVLLSEALDALGSAVVEEGGLAAAAELSIERVALLERMAVHDPRAGTEQVDIRHMALDSALVAGDPGSAIAFGERFSADPLAGELAHFVRRGLVVAHTLLGDFDTALAQAAAMRSAWERAGRPGARWMAPGALATALVHGLRGDDAARAEWDGFADHLARGSSLDFRAFTGARLALHRGDTRSAYEWSEPEGGSESRWRGYVAALRVEIAAACGGSDIPRLCADIRRCFDRQPWAEAILLRARARAAGTPAAWRRAADAFSNLGARFEWACTEVLARGPAASEGRAVLTSLGCEPPAA